MSLGGEAWKALAMDDDKGEWLLPILVLAHEHDPDADLRPGPIDTELRLELFTELAACLPELYRHFTTLRREAVLSPESRPVRRDGPKIGRNDPCPCGSGRKYKLCCGAH